LLIPFQDESPYFPVLYSSYNNNNKTGCAFCAKANYSIYTRMQHIDVFYCSDAMSKKTQFLSTLTMQLQSHCILIILYSMLQLIQSVMPMNGNECKIQLDSM